MTSIKLLHVSAGECHPQEIFQIKGRQVKQVNVGIASPSLERLKYYLLTYLLTYSMQYITSEEGNQFSASQEISRILRIPKVLYRTFKSACLTYRYYKINEVDKHTITVL